MARHMLTGTVILAVLWLSACSSANVLRSQPPARSLTPIETAVSWFHAIDADNVVAARDLFVPSQRRQLAWMNDPRSELSTFSQVRCDTVSMKATRASVYCTFKESISRSGGNPDSFWNLSMVKRKNGEWRISSYGQG